MKLYYDKVGNSSRGHYLLNVTTWPTRIALNTRRLLYTYDDDLASAKALPPTAAAAPVKAAVCSLVHSAMMG